MYLTAHHVVSPPPGRREGINVFLYLHGPLACNDSELVRVPDENPGRLVAQSISVPPPGNSVRSYLDIAASDDIRWEDVRVGLMDFTGQRQPGPLPWFGYAGRCYFQLGMELELGHCWRKELAVLYRAAQALRLAFP
ncbi:MAG: hypothetical protein JW940_01990 [Polyangiaceae bacterium]|nr:hypothetical protein [Polyangiaceae bacterium]